MMLNFILLPLEVSTFLVMLFLFFSSDFILQIWFWWVLLIRSVMHYFLINYRLHIYLEWLVHSSGTNYDLKIYRNQRYRKEASFFGEAVWPRNFDFRKSTLLHLFLIFHIGVSDLFSIDTWFYCFKILSEYSAETSSSFSVFELLYFSFKIYPISFISWPLIEFCLNDILFRSLWNNQRRPARSRGLIQNQLFYENTFSSLIGLQGRVPFLTVDFFGKSFKCFFSFKPGSPGSNGQKERKISKKRMKSDYLIRRLALTVSAFHIYLFLS